VALEKDPAAGLIRLLQNQTHGSRRGFFISAGDAAKCG
jgi:hypothetical protein